MNRKQAAAAAAAAARAIRRAQMRDRPAEWAKPAAGGAPVRGWWSESFDRRGRAIRMFVPANEA